MSLSGITRLTDTSSPYFEPAVRTLSAAFENTPTDRAIDGGVAGLNLARQRATLIEGLRNSHLEVLMITEGGDSEPEVAAMCFLKPPGLKHLKPDPKAPHNVAVAALLSPELVVIDQKLDNALHTFMSSAFGESGSNMYWIGRLATSPRHQGKGLGGILVQEALRRARAEGKDVALITPAPRVRDWYLRLGFQLCTQMEIELRGTETIWWALSKRASG